MFSKNDKVKIVTRQVMATVIEVETGDGEIGPKGKTLYLTQDAGNEGQDGLSWNEQSNLTQE